MINSNPLKKYSNYVSEKINSTNLKISEYVTTDSILQNKNGITIAESLPASTCNLTKYKQTDILLGNIRPYLKKIWLANKSGGCSSDVLVIRANENINPTFLYYALFRDDFFSHIMKGSKGTKMPRGDKDHIMEFSIPNLNMKNQIKIADVLSSIDYKIEINKKINHELKILIRTIYDYWFIQFDFPDSAGNPYKISGGKMVYNNMVKREIPEGWLIQPLSKITNLSKASIDPANSPDKMFKHFSIPIFDATNTFALELGESIGSNKYTVEETDLLISKLNPRFNRVIYAMEESDQICSTEFVVWRTTNKNIKNFLYLIATSPQFISHCMQSETGTSNSHKRVDPEVMMRFCIPFQAKISELFGKKIDPILKQLMFNQRENSILSSLRDWLLPMLMNGQIKVN